LSDSFHINKKLRRKAVKLARAERAAGGRAAPAEVWSQRLADSKVDGGFVCRSCGAFAPWEGGGTVHRNHCPRCLSSLHLDIEPGDRAAECGGIMEPIAVWVRRGGEWAIVHRCTRCGALSSNRTAADDNPALLISIAARPLAQPPFPLERLVGSEE